MSQADSLADVKPQIDQAFELLNWIANRLHELSLPNNRRTQAAAPCFAATQEHHHAIAVLLREGIVTSAFALVRSAYESYVRGVWLSYCASDEEIEKFCTGWSPPKIDVLITAIELLPEYDGKDLSRIKAASFNDMCSYTHTGSLVVQRWNTGESVESNFHVGEIIEVLNFTGAFESLTVS